MAKAKAKYRYFVPGRKPKAQTYRYFVHSDFSRIAYWRMPAVGHGTYFSPNYPYGAVSEHSLQSLIATQEFREVTYREALARLAKMRKAAK